MTVIWRFGYWPFDRTCNFLPTFRESRQRKAGHAAIARTVP